MRTLTQDQIDEALRGTEEWRQFKNSQYEVSNLGNVRNYKTGKNIKPYKCPKSGYLQISLSMKPSNYRVHRVVAIAFLDAQDGQDVNHIDFNRSNNQLSNLEVVGTMDNVRWSYFHGSYDTKLNMEKRMQIVDIASKGILLHKEIAHFYGIDRSLVSRLVRRHTKIAKAKEMGV